MIIQLIIIIIMIHDSLIQLLIIIITIIIAACRFQIPLWSSSSASQPPTPSDCAPIIINVYHDYH